VPPISELIKLRELEKFPLKDVKQPKYENIQQFGIIKFVSPEETSTTCPKCLRRFKDYDKNKQEGFCKCQCGFDTRNDLKGFEGLNDPDKVAAFNIAKRGFEDLQKYK
jgi:hypothetical protein